MIKHYIHDLSREELLEFHGDKSLCIMNTEFILQACIEQLLSDWNADRYILKDGILYDKGE